MYHGVLPQSVTNPDPPTTYPSPEELMAKAEADYQEYLTNLINKMSRHEAYDATETTPQAIRRQTQTAGKKCLEELVKKFCDEHDIPEEDRPTVEYTFYHPETGSQAIEITYKDNPEDTT